MWEIVIPAVVSFLSVIAASFLIENRMKKAVFVIKDDLLDWVHTQEGMAEIAMLGKFFGAGAMSVLKVPRGQGAPKITGIKAIDELIMGIVAKEGPKMLEGFVSGQAT